MKEKKIRYLETYNAEADMIEKSSDRLKSIIALFMAFVLIVLNIVTGGEIEWGLIMIVFLFLAYSAAPQTMQKLAGLGKFATSLKKGKG